MGEYDDIIDLPHHVSRNHPPMSMASRAAQFAPFAALTGYDGVIRETGRQTDDFIELDEDDKERLNMKLMELLETVKEHPMVGITFFKPDGRKTGGKYSTVTGRLRMIDEMRQLLIMEDGLAIPIPFISDIIQDLSTGP